MSLKMVQEGRLRHITLAPFGDLLSALRDAEADPETGAVLLDSEGESFCASVELSEAPDELYTIGLHYQKPIIAAIKGVALNVGIGLIASAHATVAAQGSSFGVTTVREGAWSSALVGALERAIGRRRALEMAMTGRVFSTAEALACGLIHHVAPAFEYDDRAFEIARLLAGMDSRAIRAALASGR